MFNSIRWRLLLAFAAVAAVPVVFITVNAVIAGRTLALENASTKTTEQFYLIDNFIDSLISYTSSELTVIKNRDYFREFAYSPDETSRRALRSNFENAMVRHPEYLQFRYINEDGLEVLRMNRFNDRLEWVAETNLQDKSGYYYFEDMKNIEPNSVYVSPLDLNVENRVVEIPHRLVARIGVPVYLDGNFKGALIVNVDGTYILKKIMPLQEMTEERAYLLNDRGLAVGLHNGVFSVLQPDTVSNRFGKTVADILNKSIVIMERAHSGYMSVMPVSFSHKNADVDWWIAIYDSDRRIFSPALKLIKPFAFAMFCIFMATVVLAAVSSSIIVERIGSIVKYTKKAHEADFQPCGIIEFDEISQAVRESALELENSKKEIALINKHLEHRVKEQVDEIYEMNEEILNNERELRRIQDQLMHADRLASLGLISAKIAHEVGNPLAAMKTSLQILATEAQEKDKEYVKKIISQVDKLNEFLRSITRFGGAKKQDKSVVKLNSIVSEVVDFLRMETRKYNISIDAAVHEDIFIECNDVEMRQVLFNIMFNSVNELAEDGGVIYVSTYTHYDSVVMSIYDTGKGAAEPEKLFEPFFTTKSSGTGLGLAIVRSITKENNWKLYAHNRDRAGLEIEITIPLAGSNDDKTSDS
jgi:signal transduction histidine kinase